MITRFITEVNTKFNPFSAASRSTRLFLANLPPNARANGGMKLTTSLLPRASTESPLLHIKFSTFVLLSLLGQPTGIYNG